MSIFNKIKKGFKKTTKNINKGAKSLGNKYVDDKINTVYKLDKIVEGDKQAKKNKKKIKKNVKNVKKDYMMASDFYDDGMAYVHNKVRNIPVVGRELDEGLYVADAALNPISQTKNILDTVSGKQTLTEGLTNQYLGDEKFLYDMYNRNKLEKQKKKKRTNQDLVNMLFV